MIQAISHLILEHNLEVLVAEEVVLLLVLEQPIKDFLGVLVGEQHTEEQTFLAVAEEQVKKDKITYLIMVNQQEPKVETEVMDLHHQ